MTIDTTVTNGHFVLPDGVIEQSVSIHEGRVLDAPEFDDVWRTIDASGHFVFPGMIQPGELTGNVPLTLARRGTTCVMLREEPEAGAALDYIVVGDGRPYVARLSDVDPLERARAGTAMLELPVDLLTGDDSDEWWPLVADESIPVHVTHGGNVEFPLLQFLFHAGAEAWGLSPSRISAVTSSIPALWYGLHPAKGTFLPGSEGDLLVFDPGTSDPYHEFPWPGRVIMSTRRGEMLLYNGQLHAPAGSGRPHLA